MHDVLEGVLPYKVKMLLVTYITERHYFELSDLNGRIQAFPFGDIESSKPTCITSVSLCSSDKKLKQSGKLHNSWALIPLLTNANPPLSIRNVVLGMIFTFAYWRPSTRGWWTLGKLHSTSGHLRLHLCTSVYRRDGGLPGTSDWALFVRLQAPVPGEYSHSKDALSCALPSPHVAVHGCVYVWMMKFKLA